MFVWYKLDPDNDINMDFEDLLKKAMRFLMAKKKLVSLVHVKKESQGAEDLVVKSDYKSWIGFNPSSFMTPSPVLTYHLPNFQFATSVQMSDADYQPVEKKIDHLTKMMRGLALLVWSLQNNNSSSTNENI